MVSRIARYSAAVTAAAGLLIPSSGAWASEGPKTGAASAILIDGRDGSVLWEKDSHEQRAVASITKIAAALVVLERASPDEVVRASAAAESVGASDPLVAELELRAGEETTVRNLLYGLLLISANDAAVALAEHVGGSETGFVDSMNTRAGELGATDTRFRNPHGLDQEGHYSSAFDVALLARRAMELPVFRAIVGTRSYDISRRGPDGRPFTTRLENRNPLLGSFAGADGIKTGQTRAAGRALAASAARKGESRIVVVLGSSDPFTDARALLDYGFDGFHRVIVATRGRTWGFATFGDGSTYRIVSRADGQYLLPAGHSKPTARFDARRRQLVIEFQSGAHAVLPVSHDCVGSCAEPRREGFLVRLWEVLAPLGRAMAALL